MTEQPFTEHWSLTHYAEILAVTEMRLNEICRWIANTSSKKIIHDRLMQEAKRLLIFTDIPINHIYYQLGLKDPPILVASFSGMRVCASHMKSKDFCYFDHIENKKIARKPKPSGNLMDGY